MLRVSPILQARIQRALLAQLEQIIEQVSCTIWVKTYCRVCGEHVYLEIPKGYQNAVELFYELDDLVEWHHGHTECGGWGFHFRFDEVLELVFPEDHIEPIWPKPDWYPHTESEDVPVRIVEPKFAWSQE